MLQGVSRGQQASYGSDASGLICGYSFTPEKEARPIDAVSAVDWLQLGHTPDKLDFVWLHFSLSNATSEKWMLEHLHLPESYFETLREGTGSTRRLARHECGRHPHG